jgi:hypothetical protein
VITSCKDVSTQSALEDSLETVEEVSLIPGTSNTAITINKSNESYFRINFSGTGTNDIISDGEREGWCIDWQMPINASNSTYEHIPLYSTYNVESWKPINYLFNIVDDLYDSMPEMTHREIQLAVWTLRGNPEFDVSTLDPENTPLGMFRDGQPLFNIEILEEILETVDAGYKTFEPGEHSRFAVIAETPADVQTVITVVEHK